MSLPAVGSHRVRDHGGRLLGVLVVVEHKKTGTPWISPASLWASIHGSIPTGATVVDEPIPTVAVVRWAGSADKWEATEEELRKFGVAERADWP